MLIVVKLPGGVLENFGSEHFGLFVILEIPGGFRKLREA